MNLTNGLVVRFAVAVMVLALCAGAHSAPLSASGETGADSPTAGAMPDGGPGDPGVSDGQVLFGQSAAFTGPAGGLGNAMRLGIQAAFYEANRDGGVHGRKLELEALNDSYETKFALSNTHDLIEKSGVFALVGAVGTPTP